MRLSIALLGSFQVHLGEQLVPHFESVKVRALLAYLAAEAGHPHDRSALAGLLWPNWPEEAAQKNLRHSLYSLRKSLKDEDNTQPYLLADRQTIQLNREADVWVDVLDFEAVNQQPTINGDLYRRNLQSAIALYRGPFLQGFSLNDSPPFEEWLLARREHYAQQMLKALSRLADAYLVQGQHEQAEGYARRQIELEPWREVAHQQLMRALSLKGERVQALAQFESLRKALQRELGVEPSEEALQLYQQIREGRLVDRKEAGLDVSHLPLTAAEKPPEAAKPLHNLPLQLTSFIGREKEITSVMQLLEGARLVTLTGPGGTGKTRLALAAAAQLLEEFEHGVWLAELARLSDPALIPSSVATLFGIRPEAGRSLPEALGDYFRSKRLLLILDNCEHLIQEAAQFADTVLQGAPEVKILATSRELLGLAGEKVYLVPSLETPDPVHLPPIQSLAAFEAVRLFSERASAVLPAFTMTETNAQAVAQICRRLDGIPLAIELAAARVKVLPAEQIAARLDDRFRLLTGGSRTAFPRHQTLHALIDWSYELLPEAERVLFRRLSVFIGGWTLEAAEGVCPCTDQMEFEVLDGLAGLVNKSLIIGEVIGGEVHRYRMLETIRQYAQEKLLGAGEAAQMRNLHLEYFVTCAEALEKKLHTPAYLEALEQLDAEVDNSRAALDWALGGSSAAGQHVKVAEGLRLATAMADYWVNRGLAQEGYTWLNTGLAMPGEEEHLVLIRARVYLRAANLRCDPDTICEQLYSQSVALYRKTDDRPGLARALINYGSLLYDTRPNNPHRVDYTTGMALIEEGIAIFEEIGDPWGLGWAFYGKSCIAFNQKDYAAQRNMLEKAIIALEQAGDILLSEFGKRELAFSLPILGDFETARRLGEQHLEFTRKINRKAESIFTLGILGEIACFQEDFTRAESCCQEALALYDEIGILWHGVVWISRMLGYCAARQGQNERARQLLLKSQSLGRKLPNGDGFGDPSGDLSFVLWMGTIAESQGQPVLAARFLGAVEGVLETFFKHLLDDLDQIEYERISEKVRAALDEATFTAAWAEGRKLNLEEALEEALAYCRQEG